MNVCTRDGLLSAQLMYSQTRTEVTRRQTTTFLEFVVTFQTSKHDFILLLRSLTSLLIENVSST
jgi:hypothetical protein